jgi:mannobiose 2-epimerase
MLRSEPGLRRIARTRALCLGLLLAACACPGAQPRPAASSAAHPDPGAGPRSAWLRDPDLVLPFVRRDADFWARSFDAERGGFYTMVARDGAPVKGQDLKTTLTQSRHAYGFARAYMLTGDRTYLAQARRALSFLREKGWDAEHGGFHTALDGAGRSLDAGGAYVNADQKWSFMQHYALLGIAAVYDAGRAPDDLALLTRARGVLDEKLWDPRPGVLGYFETAAYDWSKPEGKGFTPTVDGITTHGEAMFLVTRDPRYRARLLQLADAIVARLLPTARGLGFAERFDGDWREQREGFFFVGHVLKAAWCLNRAYLVEPKPEYRAGAEALLRQSYQTTWDTEYGGPFTSGNWITGQVGGRQKNWWTLEQAITAGLTAYHLTGDPLYLRMADESADFFERHMVDAEYGEVYGETDAAGRIVLSQGKGDYWKAAYHSIETGWYVYLYGNLFLKHRPVTLHYALDPVAAARALPLDPMALPGLRIERVLLDGKPWTAFDAAARTLTVPAGVGGEFEVTFAAGAGGEGR